MVLMNVLMQRLRQLCTAPGVSEGALNNNLATKGPPPFLYPQGDASKDLNAEGEFKGRCNAGLTCPWALGTVP